MAVEPDPARRALALARGWADLALEPGEQPLITHTYPLADVMEAYRLFEAREDGVLKVAVRP